MGIEQSRHKRALLGISLIAAAALYRPLVLWAENAWDLADPLRVFATSALGIAVAAVIYAVAMGVGARELPSALGIAGIVFVLFNYHNLVWMPGFWLIVPLAIGVVAHLGLSDRTLVRLSPILLVLTVLAPLVQVGVEHVSHRTPYPLNDYETQIEAVSSGAVEDVLVVIVDSYPMLAVAEQWFGHDTAPLQSVLTSMGFEVPRVSWSHNTFTGLAVPSILQLQQITDDSPKNGWGNRRSSYDIVGGENIVARTLRAAGFRYTHVESGWDGGVCRQVDRCLTSSWMDEANWNLLKPSILNETLTDRLGSLELVSTLRTVDHLSALSLFGDGNNDYVFAHLMLPHIPYVVDEHCRVIPKSQRSTINQERDLIREQIACVDSLLIDVLEVIDPSVAVLVAGDHGTGSAGQVGSAADEWTDYQVAERLGALVAYRLPEQCHGPRSPTNVYAMRAIMNCAVVADLPTNPVRYLLGADNPSRVDPQRLESIGNQISDGRLAHQG